MGAASSLLSALSAWVPEQAHSLEAMIDNGWLSEADAFEVSETLHLLTERVRSGAITPHFATVVIDKLAEDMASRWLAERGPHGR